MWGRWGLLLLVVPSCYQLEAYTCTEASDCTSEASGVCLPVGCAYPDEACDSGLRYSDLAAGSLAGACTEDDTGEGTDSGGSSGSGETTGPVAMDCDAVDCAGGTCVMVDDAPRCACGPGLYAVPGPTCAADPCERARCFYVDADAEAGGDGSQDAPWQSLDAAAEGFIEVGQPGDHLLLRRGARWAASLRLEGLVGTEDAPIVIGAYGTQAALPSVGQVRISQSTFVTVRDLDVDATDTTLISGIGTTFVDHIIIRDNHVHDVIGEGIGVHEGSEHTVVMGNRIEAVYEREGGSDLNLLSVADEWWSSNATDIGDHHFIIDNVLVGTAPAFEDSTDRGVVLSNRDGVGDFKVLGNRLTGVEDQGLWFQGSGFAWILRNDIGGVVGSTGLPPGQGDWHASMIISHGSRARVRGNRIFGAGQPLIAGAGAGTCELEVEHNTFAGGGDAWTVWLGDARGHLERNLVVPDPGAAVLMTDDLARLEGLQLSDNAYAAQTCPAGVFSEDPLSFEAWQEMGRDEGSTCAPVPGVAPIDSVPADPDDWGPFPATIPEPAWSACDAPAGARDCEGEPTVAGLRTWPSMPDNGGRGWEGPPIVQVRYPIE